jgi:hypothetical protein
MAIFEGTLFVLRRSSIWWDPYLNAYARDIRFYAGTSRCVCGVHRTYLRCCAHPGKRASCR